MGRMKEWGLRLAEVLFDREARIETVMDIEESIAESMGVQFPSRAWLFEQIVAVLNHPELWGFSIPKKLPYQVPEREKSMKPKDFNQPGPTLKDIAMGRVGKKYRRKG